MFSYLFRIIGIFILVLLLHQGWIYLQEHFFTKNNKRALLVNRQIEKYKAIVEEIQKKKQNASEFLSGEEKAGMQNDLATFLQETEKLNKME